MITGHAGLAGDGAREQRLAGARRADEQHALGALRAHRVEARRDLEERDDVLQVGARFRAPPTSASVS